MLNNVLNAMALIVIVAIATAAAFTPSAPKASPAVVAAAPSASAPVKVVQLPTVVIVGQRDRTVADGR